MEGRRRVRIFHALRYRDFRLLFAGQTVSLIGDAAFLTALGWKTYTLVGSGRFGIVLFCQATALLTTLLIGGALADRISRRKMMIASDLARFVAVGALAAVDASGHLNFTWIIVLSVLMGLGDGLFYPAFGGMVPLVVEPGAIPSANSLIGVARWGSLLVGPASPRCSTEPPDRRSCSRSTPRPSWSRQGCSGSLGHVRSRRPRERERCARSGPACATWRECHGSG